MRISYNKLWKLLIDKNMTKMELKDAAGISAASIAKLGKGANITTDVLLKIMPYIPPPVKFKTEIFDPHYSL